MKCNLLIWAQCWIDVSFATMFCDDRLHFAGLSATTAVLVNSI